MNPFALVSMEDLAKITDQYAISHPVMQTHKIGDDTTHIYILLKLLDAPPGSLVLDAGCGIGEVSRIMRLLRPDLSFVMVNVSGRQLDYCPSGEGMNRVQASCHSLPLKDEACDCAILLSAMCNMDIPVALKEISRVMKVGGHLLITDVARESGDNSLCLQHLFMHSFSREQIELWAKEAGLGLDFCKQPIANTAAFKSLFTDKALFHDIFQHLRYTIWRFTKF